MNPRIRQLAKQAGLDDDMFPLDEWDNPELEKFAELIVRECMSVADLPKNSSGQWDHLESSEVIAKHFGVAE
jgi:hypothetical protein